MSIANSRSSSAIAPAWTRGYWTGCRSRSRPQTSPSTDRFKNDVVDPVQAVGAFRQRVLPVTTLLATLETRVEKVETWLRATGRQEMEIAVLEELGRAGSIDGASELAAELDALFEEASGALTSWLSAA